MQIFSLRRGLVWTLGLPLLLLTACTAYLPLGEAQSAPGRLSSTKIDELKAKGDLLAWDERMPADYNRVTIAISDEKADYLAPDGKRVAGRAVYIINRLGRDLHLALSDERLALITQVRAEGEGVWHNVEQAYNSRETIDQTLYLRTEHALRVVMPVYKQGRGGSAEGQLRYVLYLDDQPLYSNALSTTVPVVV